MTRPEILAAVRAGSMTQVQAAGLLGVTKQAVWMAIKYEPTGRRRGRPRKESEHGKGG